MITHDEAIDAVNKVFEFCCQQIDCTNCLFRRERIFIPEHGHVRCGLYEEPYAWNRTWNRSE